MDSKKLCNWLKGVILGLGVAGAVFYGYVIPFLKKKLFESMSAYTPWLVFLLLTAVPCYAVLVIGWRISNRIGNNNSFCMENAKGLSTVSYLALIDTAYFFVGSIVMMFCGISRIEVLFMSVVIVFIGVAIGVAAAALSHLVRKAALLKQENDEII